MTNIQIANQYCINIKKMIKDDGVWISDNLGDMPRSERKAILKVYKKHFSIVKYTPVDGVCKCTNGLTVEVDLKDASVFVSFGEGGDHGQSVKQENMPDMAGADIVAGVISEFANFLRKAA